MRKDKILENIENIDYFIEEYEKERKNKMKQLNEIIATNLNSMSGTDLKKYCEVIVEIDNRIKEYRVARNQLKNCL